MNKLVSRSPVQRFKQGKKIVKAEEGAVARWQRRIKHPIDAYNNLDKRVPNPFVWMDNQLKKIGNSLIVENYTPENGGTINNKIRQSKQNKQKNNSNISNTNYSNQYAGSSIRNYSQQPKKTTNVINKTSPVKTSVSNNSFKLAFDTARNSGEQEFTWNDRKFNTMKKGETKEQWLSNLRPSSSPELPTSEQLIQQVPQNVPVVELVPQAGTNTIQNQLTEVQKVMPIASTYIMNPTLPKLNRSDTRWVINDALGKNAYNFTGAQRRALRQYLNGEQYNANDLAAFGNLDIFNKYKSTQSYKKGGNMLPSKNIVERFKQRNFR